MHTASETEFHVDGPRRTYIDPGRKPVIARNISAPRGLLVALKYSPVRRRALVRSLHQLAEDRLLAGGQNVVPRRAHAEELPEIVGCAGSEMCVEAQGCIGPHEQPRIGDGVRDANFCERRQVRKSVVDVVGPVKRAAARAETLLAIGYRGESRQR